MAIPCASCRCGKFCARFDPMRREMCDATVCPMVHVASEGIDDDMRELAQRLRPDINVAVRAYHLKQAADQIGPELNRLDGYYCLCSVSLPFSRSDINSSKDWERCYREEIRCQIDVGVTAEAAQKEGENAEATAKRALGETCGVNL